MNNSQALLHQRSQLRKKAVKPTKKIYSNKLLHIAHKEGRIRAALLDNVTPTGADIRLSMQCGVSVPLLNTATFVTLNHEPEI